MSFKSNLKTVPGICTILLLPVFVVLAWGAPQDAVAKLEKLLEKAESKPLIAHLLNLSRQQPVAIAADKLITALEKALDNDDTRVRRMACNVMRKLQSDKVIPALVRALKDRKVDIRGLAVEILVELGTDRSIDALAGVMADPRSIDRELMIKGMVRGKAPRIGVRLREFLYDQNPKIRYFAMDYLAKTAAPETVEVFAGVLQHRDIEMRLKAVKALGKVNSQRAAELLAGVMIEDKVGRIRWAAAQGLAPKKELLETGASGVIPALSEALRDEYPRVSDAAARILTQLGAPEAKKALEERYK